LNKEKHNKKKLKVRKSRLRHKTIIPGDLNMNREKLVKTELEYSDISESEEEESSEEGNKTIHYFSDSETLFKCEGSFYSAGQILALKDIELDWIWILMMLLAIGLTILFNLYICPTEVILRLLHGIQFQVKSLTFGLRRSDKKAKSFELLAKASVKMLEGDSLSKVEEGEIEKINKEKEELRKLEKEENKGFMLTLMVHF
jgi:hypothetical protein